MSYLCRRVKGVDCICLSLNFLNSVLGTPNDKICIQHIESTVGNQMQLMPYKTRQRFLSPESDQDNFKVTKLICPLSFIQNQFTLFNTPHTGCVYIPSVIISTVLVKCKLTVSTRNSILNVFRVSSHSKNFSRISNRNFEKTITQDNSNKQ